MQWINLHQNNSLVNQMRLPLFICLKNVEIYLVLVASRQSDIARIFTESNEEMVLS